MAQRTSFRQRFPAAEAGRPRTGVVSRPQYLFCDEPNSGLDPQTAIVIDNLIQDRPRNGTTVVISHDMA